MMKSVAPIKISASVAWMMFTLFVHFFCFCLGRDARGGHPVAKIPLP